MAETRLRGRRLALLAAMSAAILGVSTVVVVAADHLTAPGHDGAARVAAEKPVPPVDSDVLSDEQAKARDRARRQAENARIRGLLAPDVSLEDFVPDEPVVAVTSNGRDIDCTQLKCVAITFDDGPGSQTDQLLAMLRAADALATWFPLGEVVSDSPERLRAIAEAGHEIGNHSWSHPQLTATSNGQIETQISRTADLIDKLLGTRPTLVRPPYGAINKRVAAELRQLNAPAILWDVDPLDWKYRNSDRVYRSVMSQVRPGSIVLLHDIHPTTVAAMPRILRALANRGYTFVTVSELFGNRLVPGQIYLDRAEGYRRD
ncbi:MAG TPA: polysaccharide deacetylase family protein [Sporichthya sp.]|nr:polysaccharide deacetylase family protein [Sporichthya sp.]